jgi:hypothetical protein
METHRSRRETNVTRRWFTVTAILAMLLGLLPSSISAASLAAQVAVPVSSPQLTVSSAVVNASATDDLVPSVYLPVVLSSGQPAPPPASPYAAALSEALADCTGTALNQVCYAGGSVTLDGGGPLTAPGQVATLDGVSGLTLVSPDAGHWSVALLRLAAEATTPDLGLTVLAFGNVEIRNLTLFDAATDNGDVAPALSFSSSPVPGEASVTGGLLVYNPNDEESLSITLNGADLTLASSAIVEAQPGVKMTVTMAKGTAIVNTAAGDGGVIRGQQLSVPLDGNGVAAGAPTPPTEFDDSLLAPLVIEDDDLLTPLVPSLIADLNEELDDLLAKFDSAYERCMQGDSRQVYRVMVFARLLKKNEAHLPGGLLSLIDVQVMQCATFELEFNSVISTTTPFASGSMYVQEQGIIASYDMDGHLVQPAQMPLEHRYYDVVFALAQCLDPQVEIIDGKLIHSEGYMRVNRNRLDISTLLAPAGIFENLTWTCADQPLPYANAAAWWTLFRKLHDSEYTLTGFQFTPDDWKYTGNHILAEAILSREMSPPEGGLTAEDTFIVLIHSPGQ